ncbi:MAG TPA: VUT family protein, partial [Vicinamibacteria bacterium]|nr:VUT family protein [Vicinamibacteria bacterium]
MTRTGLAALGGYIATIYLANLLIVTVGIVPVGLGLMAPAGVYAAGLAFSLRDAVRETLGPRWMLVGILAGAALSALLSPALALASGAAFLLSELADAAVYEPLRARGRTLALAASNVVGLAVDSALFLWLAFGALDFLAGQIVGKALMIIPAVAFLALWRRRQVR